LTVNTPSGANILFAQASPKISSTEATKIDAVKKAWVASGSFYDININGYASAEGSQRYNWRLSCNRAEQVKVELSMVIPEEKISTIAHGETDEFSKTDYAPNRCVVITPLSPIKPHPLKPRPPLCPTVPTSTPLSCAARHNAYCEAARCFPTNPWLACACVASGDVCEAVDAFTFTSNDGKLLEACVIAPPATPVFPIINKGFWLLITNERIWSHWRVALEAIHDLTLPIPSTLTPEWGGAVITCRRDGIGSKTCCQAQVVAEQTAIDRFNAYDSILFGPLPSDVPGAPSCSAIVRARAPGIPFVGDFGKVGDRIVYGIKRCC
jgi:hypothetical protein